MLNRLHGEIRLVAMALLVLAGCAGNAAPPQAGEPAVRPPSLISRRVMVLPVQEVVGVPGNLDAELTFALSGRGDEVLWIFPDAVREALARSPSMRVPLDALPVSMFLNTEVRRVGDPLYGMLRRAAALMDAEVAMIPVQVGARPSTLEKEGGIEIRVALIHIVTGDVLWYGVEQGTPGDGRDPSALASAMEAMARRLVPGT